MNNRGSYWINLFKGLDYGLATLFGIPAGIYISSYAAFKRKDSGKKVWVLMERFINWLFKDAHHCEISLEHNAQDIKEYYS